MMQGDSYGILFEIKTKDGILVTPDNISDIEISIGFLHKTVSRGEIAYDDGLWVFPITQRDTFDLPVGRVKAQVRVLWTNGAVEGVAIKDVKINESISRKVL